jgi:hypothetical protein
VLASHRGRLIAELDRLFEEDPEALLWEIAAFRAELAEEKAAELLRTKPKDGLAGKVSKLRASSAYDDRLAVAIYDARRSRETTKDRQQRRQAERIPW